MYQPACGQENEDKTEDQTILEIGENQPLIVEDFEKVCNVIYENMGLVGWWIYV